MSFSTALTNLAGLSVAGVTRNYAIDTVPDTLNRGQLPPLLVWPVDLETERLFNERGSGFLATAFSSGARTVNYQVTHLLALAPARSGSGMRSHLPGLITLIDAYFTALGADVTLSGALVEPAHVKVEPGIYAVGGVSYYGCAFRHSWLVEV